MNSRTTQIAVAALALIVVFGGFWKFAVSPKKKDLDAVNAQIATTNSATQQSQANIANYLGAKKSFAANYESVTRLGKAVPADDDVQSLLVQLQGAAKAANIDFRTISVANPSSSTATPAAGAPVGQAATAQLPPGAAVGTAGLPTMPFTFSFKGSFFDLSDFLARLEQFVTTTNKRVKVTGRLLSLDALELKPDTAGFPHIRANVNATSYLVPADEGLLGGATAAGPNTDSPIAVTNRTTPAPATAATGATSAADATNPASGASTTTTTPTSNSN